MNFVKQIHIEHGLRKQIMNDLGVTYPTVKAALTYKSNTLTARTIRKYAIEHGGVILQGVTKEE